MKKSLDPKLQRLLEGLQAVGAHHGSRNKMVAEKAGYSESTVLKALSGNTPSLSSRFYKTVCRVFGISLIWVEEGVGSMLEDKTRQKSPLIEHELARRRTEIIADLMGKIEVARSQNESEEEINRKYGWALEKAKQLKAYAEMDPSGLRAMAMTSELDPDAGPDALAINVAVRFLKKMPRPMQWQAVSKLEEMLMEMKTHDCDTK